MILPARSDSCAFWVASITASRTAGEPIWAPSLRALFSLIWFSSQVREAGVIGVLKGARSPLIRAGYVAAEELVGSSDAETLGSVFLGLAGALVVLGLDT